jgi:hypothetical protein
LSVNQALTSTLNPDNPITLDDVYEYLPYLPTTQAIASAVDARDYYEENRRTILRRTAQALFCLIQFSKLMNMPKR